MADRYEVTAPRVGRDGKTRWTRIGTAWPAKDGQDGFNIEFDALPLPDKEGRVSAIARPPRPKDGDPELNDNPGF